MGLREFETLKLEQITDEVLLVLLNRPEVSNAFNTQMAKDLVECFENLSLNSEGNRAIVLSGAGDKAFCAGGDLKERKSMSDEDWGLQHLIFERMIRAVMDCPIPIIAAVNGAAYAGGCELAAATDFIYASDSSRFAQTEARIGIIPGAGGTQNLARAMGERRAKEIILSAKPFSAQQAKDWRLVNEIYPQNEVLSAALEMAQIIANNAPIAVRQAKQAIHKGMQMSVSDGLSFEIEAYNRTVPTEDRREGVLAFNEKRQPVFKGQ
jgi:enoyl-CoA hydratase